MNLDEVLGRHQALLKRVLRPAIALRPTSVETGRSRLGGDRMLARPGESWPVFEGEPLILLAQVELDGSVDGAPSGVILQAFVSYSNLPVMGDETSDFGPTRLRLLRAGETLEWISNESGAAARAVSLESIQTMPDSLPEELDEAEEEILREAFKGAQHQVLGHIVDPIQYDPLEYPQFNPKGNRVLILQIDSDPALGWNWVHSGILYFLADGDAFAEGRLEDVLFEMQFF